MERETLHLLILFHVLMVGQQHCCVFLPPQGIAAVPQR